MALVLVVEDDADIRDALRSCLEPEGYQVEECVNGRGALDRLALDPPPQAIVLDLMMPVVNGFEVLAEIKAQERWARIPIIIVSANRGYSAEDLGVASVLRKPFRLPDLLAALEAITQGRPAA